MKNSFLCYMMGGASIAIGVAIVVFVCTETITSVVTIGITYCFVRLFDMMGDDWTRHETRHHGKDRRF